jgi:hypothetical protein
VGHKTTRYPERRATAVDIAFERLLARVDSHMNFQVYWLTSNDFATDIAGWIWHLLSGAAPLAHSLPIPLLLLTTPCVFSIRAFAFHRFESQQYATSDSNPWPFT